MKKILFATLVALAALVGCKPNGGGKVDPVLPEATLSAPAQFVDGAATVDVVLSAAATEEVTAKLELSGDLDADNVAFNPSVVVKAGQTKASVKVDINPTCPDGEYNVTLTLKEVKNAVLGAKNSATIKAIVEPAPELKIALDTENDQLSCNTQFTDKPIASGANFSVEVKFYAKEWNHFGGDVYCNRLCNFENIDESTGIMFRYSNGNNHDGELHLTASSFLGGEPWVKDAEGKAYVWAPQTWHTATIVVEGGETMKVYDNGTLLSTYNVTKNKEGFNFERFELGMTWDDGSNWPRLQMFKGYIEYARFWTKSLTESEIKAGLCHVDHDAEGLALCWEFNPDGGAVAPDVTGNGRDFDFSKVFMMSPLKVEDKSDIVRSQWVDWDEDEMGALCPEL